MERNTRAIDRYLLKVGTVIAIYLSIKVGKQAALKEGILGEVDAANNMAGLELALLI
jgi:hypothetical protein